MLFGSKAKKRTVLLAYMLTGFGNQAKRLQNLRSVVFLFAFCFSFRSSSFPLKLSWSSLPRQTVPEDNMENFLFKEHKRQHFEQTKSERGTRGVPTSSTR